MSVFFKSSRALFLLLASISFLFPAPALAQSIHDGCGAGSRFSMNYINTAIGCIPINNFEDFVGFFTKWGVGIGGGIAFFLLLYGAFQVMTSAGDPKRLQAGQELLSATISGLIFIIFSVFILRFIGVDILGIFD